MSYTTPQTTTLQSTISAPHLQLATGLLLGDALIDEVLADILRAATQPEVMEMVGSCGLQNWRQLNPLPKSLIHLDSLLPNQWQIPMSPDMVAKAKKFFLQNQSAVYLILGTYSLPYCYQSEEGAKTLFHSKRLHLEPLARLQETAQFIDAVFTELQADQVTDQLKSVLTRVRLIHALVRSFSSKHRAGYVAINQTELLGTGLSFSMVVLRGLRKLGVIIPPDVAEAWLMIWNNISHLLGVEQSLLPTDVKEAWLSEQYIVKLCFRPSTYAADLTAVLCNALDETAAKSGSAGMIAPTGRGMLKFFLGDEASETLGISKSERSASGWQLQLMAQFLSWQYANLPKQA